MLRILLAINVFVFLYIELRPAHNSPAMPAKAAATPSYASELARVSEAIGVQPEWLQATIVAESGGNPSARNQYQHVGLIQFAPATARGLGYTPDSILRMSATAQLALVERFYAPVAGRIRSYADLRLYTFFPRAFAKPDSFVLQAPGISAQLVALRNPSFDLDGDGQITVSEFKKRISK